MPTEPPYLNTSEAAALLRCGKRTLERWRQDPEHPLPWRVVAGKVLYARADLLAFLAPSHR